MIERVSEATPAASVPAAGEAETWLEPRQYEFLSDATTRLLAARGLGEQLSLAAESLTARLGCAGAAVALIDAARGVLRVRASAGFAGGRGFEGAEAALDDDSPQVRVVHDGRPAWVTREEGDAAALAFLERAGGRLDVLMLPLSGGQAPPVSSGGEESAHRPEVNGRDPRPPCAGVLYVGARRAEFGEAQTRLLTRFARRLGLILSNTARAERLSDDVRRLRRERQWAESVMESVADPIVLTNIDHEILLQNRRAEELFSDTREAGEGAATRAQSAARDNSVKLTSLISAHVSDAERGRRAEIELLDPATGKPLPMEITSAEVTDAEGRTSAVVSILHDLSEIRELERRRVEQRLFESEKLAAVGRLAASIAHEVNNPLEAIKNSLYLISSSKDIEQHARFLEVARKETERVSHIIRQMLGFARRPGEVERVDLNLLLDETLVLVEQQMGQARVHVGRELDPALPHVRARADQLRQVFLNLLLNAQQAIERGGEITVRTRPDAGSLRPGVAVEVSDTGRGISEADLAHIFEPFFSTRPKGTGLGLWVTHDIVRHHDGRIEVTSTPGSGTTFRVILPVDSPGARQTGAPPRG